MHLIGFCRDRLKKWFARKQPAPSRETPAVTPQPLPEDAGIPGTLLINTPLGRISRFYQDQALLSFTLPEGIRELPCYCFSGCTQLREVSLGEGLTAIGPYAFSHCDRLQQLTVPDSVTQADPAAFCDLDHLQSPALSRSGTVFYRCPDSLPDTYSVPQGVTEIFPHAFENAPCRRILLPDSLQIIQEKAFCGGALEEITIPASALTLEDGAFAFCKNLHTLHVPSFRPQKLRSLCLCCGSREQPLQICTAEGQVYTEKILSCLNIPYGCDGQELTAPVPFFLEDPWYQSLTDGCSRGDSSAMLALSQYYRSLGSDPFYDYAANFWLKRAQLRGNSQARQLLQTLKQSRDSLPGADTPVPRGEWSGQLLRLLGFESFGSGTYLLHSPDPQGLVLAEQYAGCEDPDDDGFGREEEYHCRYLDDNYAPLPGISVFCYCSAAEMDSPAWQQYRQQALQALRKSRGPRK